MNVIMNPNKFTLGMGLVLPVALFIWILKKTQESIEDAYDWINWFTLK